MLKKIPVVTAINQKGGVGKTEITMLLAEYFALVKKKRVLVFDTDMQCNASQFLVGMDIVRDAIGGQLPPIHPDYNPLDSMEERSSVADIFEGKSVLPYSSWVQTPRDSEEPEGYVDVLCGHPAKLEKINNIFYDPTKPLHPGALNSLRKFIDDEGDPKDQENTTIHGLYDIVLIDTGPSRTPLFRAALRASSHIIIPFKPAEKDIQGMVAMLQALEQENNNRPDSSLKLIGLLPSIIRAPRVARQTERLESLQKAHGDMLFPEESWIYQLTAFEERDKTKKGIRSIFELPNHSPARRQATKMAEYVESKIFSEEETK